MFEVGDIVQAYAPTAGYPKYFLCIQKGTGNTATKFLFLNSDPNFDDTYVVDCTRVPCLPPSETGKTAFSFSEVPRFTAAQLKLQGAVKRGEIDKGLAAELAEFCKGVRSLPRGQRIMVQQCLQVISEAT